MQLERRVFAGAEDLKSNLANPRRHAKHEPQHSSFGVPKGRGVTMRSVGITSRPKVASLGVPRNPGPGSPAVASLSQVGQAASTSGAIEGQLGQAEPEVGRSLDSVVASGPNVGH